MLICNAIFAFCHQGDAINIKRGNQEQQIGRNGKNNFDRLVIKIKQINFLYWQNVHIWCLIKDSFLYNRIMKDLRHSSPTVLRKSVLAYCKAEFAFFFYLGLLSRIFTIHRTAVERRRYLYLLPTTKTLSGLLLQRAHLFA